MDMNPQTTALLFPGQGSQAVGMGRILAEQFPAAQSVFQEADQILGFPLSQMAWNGPDSQLNDTINTQPALFVHSAAALNVFADHFPGFQPAYVAGHSMGELSALHAAGALPFAEGLLLARERGQLMKQAGEVSPGGMAAVMGLDIPTLDVVCAKATQDANASLGASGQAQEVVQVANDNSPGQVVISGSRLALNLALALAQEAGARRTIPLAVSIAAHSPLMAVAQQGFSRAVAAAPIIDPRIPVIGNVTASPLTTTAQVRADLEGQLTHRVRWTETIEWLSKQGITHFIEIGSGSVLTGLVKRIIKEATGFALGTPEDFIKLAV